MHLVVGCRQDRWWRGQRRHLPRREQRRGAVLTAVQNQQNRRWQVLATAVRRVQPEH